MRRLSPRLSILSLLLAGALLVACGTSVPTPAPTTSSQSSATAALGLQPSAPAGGLSVVDTLGRTVEFSQPPQRIVALGKGTLALIDTIFLFPEAQQRIVALGVGQQPVGDFLKLVDPAFDQKTILETGSGPEQVAPYKPDLVVLRSSMSGAMGPAMEELDIPVVYVDLETPEQYFRDLVTLGQVFGDEARAQEIETFYRSRLDAISAGLQGLAAEAKPRVLIVQYSDLGNEVAFDVPPVSWIQTAEAELAGGTPVWTEAAKGSGWTVVNFEQIAAWDPDQVYVVTYQRDSAEVVTQLKADPQWRALKAVQQDKIYGFPADIFSWDQPDPRWILGVTWLAGKMHPDLFPDLDMNQEILEFFGQMYGMDEAAIQAGIVPNLKGDVE